MNSKNSLTVEIRLAKHSQSADGQIGDVFPNGLVDNLTFQCKQVQTELIRVLGGNDNCPVVDRWPLTVKIYSAQVTDDQFRAMQQYVRAEVGAWPLGRLGDILLTVDALITESSHAIRWPFRLKEHEPQSEGGAQNSPHPVPASQSN